MRKLLFLIIASAIAMARPALADTLDDCASEDANTAIAACSEAIGSLGLTGDLLSWAYSNRGHAYLKLRENEAAERDFNNAIRLNQTNLGALNGRGIARGRRGAHREALDDYERMLEIDPGNATALNNGAYEKLALGFPEDAIADARLAVADDPYNGIYRDTLGDMLGRNCRVDEAMAEYDLANSYYPEWASFKLEQMQIDGFWDGPITDDFPEEARLALAAWISSGCVGV